MTRNPLAGRPPAPERPAPTGPDAVGSLTAAVEEGTPGPAPAGARTEQLREAFFAGIIAVDEQAALAVLERGLDSGLTPEEVLLEVIGPAQARVGAEWAASRMSVADEHAATAISDRAVAALSRIARNRTPDAPHGLITVACVVGEWHALPARMLAEALQLRGWRVEFLGANVPVAHLVSRLHATGPDAVALSCSLPVRLPGAHATITACQTAGVPVLAGGAGFGADGRYARLLGADLWAPTGASAADRLEETRHRLPFEFRLPTDPLISLPHLLDQEHNHVSTSHTRLVGVVMDGLGRRLPAMRDWNDAQLRHTEEDLAHIVDFLAAALYVDDPELLTDFLTWTAGILTARGVPAQSLDAGLELLHAELRELPRASAMIDLGRRSVSRLNTGQG